MNLSLPFFHLYCVNNKCSVSIYNHSGDFEMPLTAENLVEVHFCSCCQKQLISAIDIEIEELVTFTDVKLLYKLNYN